MGRDSAETVGFWLPEESVQIGSRLVPRLESLRRAAKCRELRLQELKIQQQKNTIVAGIAKVQDTKCIWPGCEAAPLPRGKWCPTHKRKHKKTGGRDRQRWHRKRKRIPP